MKNVLLIAVGGSGRRLAVSLLEKIKSEDAEKPTGTYVNCQVVAIDFGQVQDSGFFVSPNDYFSIVGPWNDITDRWADFEKKKNTSVDTQEPWMEVGPISDIELWLARDAQQSGIRRVDYELCIYQAREQIFGRLQETLLNSFSKANGSNSEIEVIILGSLAGRTGSLTYPAVLKILESLALEFNLKSCHSFLYSPSVFQELFFKNDERVFNFMVSTTKISKLIRLADSKAFKPIHFLLDETSPLLSVHRDWQSLPHQEIPYSETVEMILNFIQLDTSSENWGDRLNNWRKDFPTAEQQKLEDLVGLFLAINANSRYYESELRGVKKVNYEEIFINLK